jgi:DNA-binding helix-hairpin-helix protein with protein kinase domain
VSRGRIQAQRDAAATDLARRIKLLQETGIAGRLLKERGAAEEALEASVQRVKRGTQAALAEVHRKVELARGQMDANVQRTKAAYDKQLKEAIETRRLAVATTKASLDEVERELSDHERRWKEKQARGTSAIKGAADQCRRLEGEYQAAFKKLRVQAEQAARARHLRLQLIADSDIPDIGPERRRLLATHRILTAADVSEAAVRRIKGFGPRYTGRLVAWRREVERQFQFDPQAVLQSPDHRTTVTELRHRERGLLDTAQARLAELELAARDYSQSVQALITRAKAAVLRYEQAKTDLAVAELAA